MRFYLFAGFDYDAAGGMHDYEGSFVTVEDAIRHVADSAKGWDWWHIANENMQIVDKGFR